MGEWSSTGHPRDHGTKDEIMFAFDMTMDHLTASMKRFTAESPKAQEIYASLQEPVSNRKGQARRQRVRLAGCRRTLLLTPHQSFRSETRRRQNMSICRPGILAEASLLLERVGMHPEKICGLDRIQERFEFDGYCLQE